MRLISVFNNKGGVGKTTLSFHLAHALATLQKKTLLIDLDPQCNLTILSMSEEHVHDIWAPEDPYIDDFRMHKTGSLDGEFDKLIKNPRTIHFLLKPTEDGVTDIEVVTRPYKLAPNLDLIPGRLSMHLYEDKLASRWSEVYQGDPLAIRTVTRIRDIASEYADRFGYEYVIVDTSPSLGMLNRVVISTADGFLIPCMPDLFSLYGIKNIGNSLKLWQKQFQTISHLLSATKRSAFPESFVHLLGFTVYNAKKYSGGGNPWQLAKGHMNYARKIPLQIKEFVPSEIRGGIPDNLMSQPIGGVDIMHTHNTFPSMAQKYHRPMWDLPDADLDSDDAMTIRGNRSAYEETRKKYQIFATRLMKRLEYLP